MAGASLKSGVKGRRGPSEKAKPLPLQGTGNPDGSEEGRDHARIENHRSGCKGRPGLG